MPGQKHQFPASVNTISQLPEPVLARILQHLPQRDRMFCCAVVSRTWAAAANAATTTADLVCTRQYDAFHDDGDIAATRLASFQAWLEQHAQQLVSVSVRSCDYNYSDPRPHLPLRLPPALPQLRQLNLSNMLLQLSEAASQHPGTGQPAAPGTTNTGQSQPDDASGAGLAVVQLPQLTRLHVYLSIEATALVELCSVRALLQQAPQLAELELQCLGHIEDEAPLAALSSMRRLRCCRIHGTSSPAWTTALCGISTLTELEVAFRFQDALQAAPLQAAPLSNTTWRSSLKRLCLGDTKFEPAVLANLQQLESLQLERCAPWLPQDGDDDVEFGAEASPASTAALLAMLPQMQQLRELGMNHVGICAAGVHWERVPALTGLSMLQAIRVYNRSQTCQPLPQRTLRHLLPTQGPGAQLQALTALEIVADEESYVGFDWCVGAADIDAVASSCPNLARLQLEYVVQHRLEAVSSIVRLQQQLNLPWLSLAGRCVSDATTAKLAEMSSLRFLQLANETSDPAVRLTDHGYEPLTALRQLTELTLTTNEFNDIHITAQLSLQATPESMAAGQPDVCIQLDKKLDQSPLCAPMRLQRLQQVLQELLAAAAEQERQKADVLQLVVNAQQNTVDALRAAKETQQEMQETLQLLKAVQEELSQATKDTLLTVNNHLQGS